MKYSDVVQIPPPLEEVKQVRGSATLGAARVDVETYVISDRMATQLAEIVVPNLRFDAPSNNKGMFVVGTYGTGKTHLMSVIAAVAGKCSRSWRRGWHPRIALEEPGEGVDGGDVVLAGGGQVAA
ncbi:MAG: DUF6079 family protein [Actinomycetota bacterium]